MLFLAVGFAWFGSEIRYAKRQHMAVESLLAKGGKVYWDYEFDNGRLASWEASQGMVKPPGPKWLKAVAGKQGFAEVTYVQSGFDDTVPKQHASAVRSCSHQFKDR